MTRATTDKRFLVTLTASELRRVRLLLEDEREDCLELQKKQLSKQGETDVKVFLSFLERVFEKLDTAKEVNKS